MPTFRGSGSPTGGADVYDQATLDAAVTDAQTAEANAAASASAAATSESNAAASETAAAASEAAAATSESNAAASAAAAATSETNAATSETNAAASEAAAAASYDSFDDRYLGPKASDPTLDNDGNALLEGALYWNTTTKLIRVYNGTAWETSFHAYPALAGNANKFLQVNSGATAEQWFDLFGSANTWTAQQSIEAAQPTVALKENDSTDQDHYMRLIAGDFFLSRFTDAGALVANVLKADNDAMALAANLTLHGLDSSGALRASGYPIPAAGAGVEIGYLSSIGYISTYNRDTSAWQPLYLRGNQVQMFVDGVARLQVFENSVQHNGGAAANFIANAAAGSDGNYVLRENGNNKGVMFYDASNHWLELRKYNDATPTTVEGRIRLENGGGINLIPSNSSAYQLTLPGNTKRAKYDDIEFGEWESSASFTGLFHVNRSTNGYALVWDATNTYLSTNNASGIVHIRPGLNQASPQFRVQTSQYDWNAKSQVSYAFAISSGGTGTGLPSGWSASKIATGQYRITHNKGDGNYQVCVTPDGAGGGGRVGNVNRASNTFDIFTFFYNSTTATDLACNVIYHER